MDERTRLCARFRPGAHTSPVELLNAPCNRCEGWCACTGNTSVTRLDRCFLRAHHGGCGRCVRQRGRTTDSIVRLDTRTTPYFQNAAQGVRSTRTTFWRFIIFGPKARCAFRTPCWEQGWCISHAIVSKIDRGQELVG